MKSGSGRGRNKSSGGRSENNFSGIHHRRDKRYPMQSSRSLADIEAAQHTSNELDEESADLKGVDAEWNEALMLWLSWNSTYEKVTAKMCKPGQNAVKLERMMDEMDQLRSQAIETTERLLESEVAV